MALAIALFLGTLLILGSYASEVRRGIWNAGLLLMFAGRALMLAAALTGLILQLVREIVLGR